jgi:hypothetical protein
LICKSNIAAKRKREKIQLNMHYRQSVCFWRLHGIDAFVAFPTTYGPKNA